MTERLDDPQRADKPRASYEPLTEGRINEIKAVILADRENWPSKAYGREIDVLCAMAVNSLLYAEEIERLRTRSAVVASKEDIGPWRIVMENNGATLYSEDFGHDVAISFNGDFADNEQIAAYAESLVKRLSVQSASERTDDFALVRSALHELVHLKQIKRMMESGVATPHDAQKYENTKEAVWKRAEAVLNATDATTDSRVTKEKP